MDDPAQNNTVASLPEIRASGTNCSPTASMGTDSLDAVIRDSFVSNLRKICFRHTPHAADVHGYICGSVIDVHCLVPQHG